MEPAAIFATLLLPVVQALSPTLAEVRNLPAERAGHVLLAGRAHRPIVAVEIDPRPGGMAPPGLVDVDLVEAAVPQGALCVRRRWRLAFRHDPGTPRARARVDGPGFTTSEVARPAGRGCPSARYAYLDPKIDAATAAGAFDALDALRDTRATTPIACGDTTASELCRDGATLRRRLREMSPWAVVRVDGAVALWLGVPGQAVTEIRFSEDGFGNPAVERRIPAPF